MEKHQRQQIEKKLTKVTRKLLTGRPLIEPAVLAAELGIYVKDAVFSPTTTTGITQLNETKPTFYINSELPADRKRFTLAHQIGHFLLHRGVNKDFVDYEHYYFASLLSKTKLGIDEIRCEEEANYFARVLLLPESEVISRWNDKIPIHKIIRFFNVTEAILIERLAEIPATFHRGQL